MANWTVPVGVPAPGAVAPTVAVKVTDRPVVDGSSEDWTEVLVAARFTCCAGVRVALEAAKSASPT
jgi:hypothetical protein